jgi:exoribonuclease II
LRCWPLEYLKRQPKGRKYIALILKFVKDHMGALLFGGGELTFFL